MGQIEINFENGIAASCEQYPPERWSVSYENPLEGRASLVHSFDNSENGTDCITFFHEEADMSAPLSCEFLLRYDYNPSAANNWAMYLFSEKAADRLLDKSNHALLLGVNQNGSDDMLCLYSQHDGEIKTLLRTELNWQEEAGSQDFGFRLIFENDSVFIFGGIVGEPQKSMGKIKCKREEFPGGQFAGLCYRYTSSKDRLLHFDGFKMTGKFVTDTLGPDLIGIGFPYENRVVLTFDEDIFAGPGFSCRVNDLVDSTEIVDNRIVIYCDEVLVNDEQYSLELNDIYDRKGNRSAINRQFVYYYPALHDVVINEILYDPAPSVYLPEQEFIELHNRSRHFIDLSSWAIKAGRNKWLLQEGSVDSMAYVVISKGDFPDLLPLQICIPEGSSNLLNNSGTNIYLEDRNGKIIDAVYYSGNWYNDSFKSAGGWSLEKLDQENMCPGMSNWRFSEDPRGGTPGAPNSVQVTDDDDRPPFPARIVMGDSSSFFIRFTESLAPETLPGQHIKVKADGVEADSVAFSDPFRNEVFIRLNPQNHYPVQINFHYEISDCSANTYSADENRGLDFPSVPGTADVLISEVLFAPFPSCPEFIELYNASGKIISLNDLRLTFSEDAFTSPPEETLMDEPGLLFPGEYLVVSELPEKLHHFFEVKYPGKMLALPSLCKLPDSGGRILLFNRSGKIIDEMHYNKDDHFPMLTDIHGVSLERVRLDENPGYLSEWHSASSLCGFATPGYENSQAVDKADENSSVFIAEEELFTPDNDGRNDVAVFQYLLKEEGYVGTLRIFDARGSLVFTPGSNELMGTDGEFIWDGRDFQGKLCPSGIYLGVLEIFHLSGRKKKFRRAVVLSRGRP